MTEQALRSSHLWFDPTFGASGDMLLGCLVGLGVPVGDLVDGLRQLPIDNDAWQISHTTTTRNGLSADRVSVETEESHHHRTWSSIDRMLASVGVSGDLPKTVVDSARATFRRLGEIEAAMHDVSIDEVHFHEVGALDAIIDITGTWLAVELLKKAQGDITISCGPIGLGSGTVQAAHGALPIPAPATAAILTGAPVKSAGQGETVTPTGAALLWTMTDRWGPLPSGTLAAISRGAGGRDPDGYPNVISAYLIGSDDQLADGGAEAAAPVTRTTTAVLSTNLDDVPGEVLAHVIARCLQSGADDAWAQPIVMKKGRPGYALNVMCPADSADRLRDLIMAETGTLGIRQQLVFKDMASRTSTTVTVHGQPIRIKVGPHRAKPEFDDLEAAARVLDLPIGDLSEMALSRLRELQPGHN